MKELEQMLREQKTGMKEIDTGLRMMVVGTINVYKGLGRVIPMARHAAMHDWKEKFWAESLEPFVRTVCRAVGINPNRFGF